ncbi:MAG: SH3 domain-containing protein, partial [Tumebacillaceae bacterium]
MKNVKRMIALLLLFSLTFTVVSFAAEGARFVKVIAYDVNIRSGASTENKIVGHADYGDSLEVMGTSNGWYQVRWGRGQVGWISASLVREGGRFSTKNPTIEVAEATGTDINVREGASTSYNIITTISPGTTYPLLQSSGDWVQIRLPDERTGWVYKHLVSVTEQKAQDAAQEELQQATVITDILNIRTSPALNGVVVGTLRQGEIVKVRKVADGWAEIQQQDGIRYVKSEYIKLPTQPAPPAEVEAGPAAGPTLTLTEPTNIRSGPGTNFALLHTGAAGTTLAITGKAGQWYEIALADGKKGWVAGWLPKINGSVAGVPAKGGALDGSLHGKTIVIDAGHGGYDVGAIGTSSAVYEKDVTYSLSRILYNKLLATGANVVLTRPDDSFVSLADRVETSKRQKADAFVSLHYNTNANSDISGTMTFYYTADGADAHLARTIQDEISQTTGSKDLGARFGDYYVLR